VAWGKAGTKASGSDSGASARADVRAVCGERGAGPSAREVGRGVPIEVRRLRPGHVPASDGPGRKAYASERVGGRLPVKDGEGGGADIGWGMGEVTRGNEG
jgi:hypothetical protein